VCLCKDDLITTLISLLRRMHLPLLSISPHVHRGNFFQNEKFKAPVVYMVLNKYITKSKVIYITLGNAPGALVCSWTITKLSTKTTKKFFFK